MPLLIFFDSAQQSCSASRSNFSSLSKWAIPPKETLSSKIGLRYKSDKLLARIVQCAVKSHGSPVGETKQTHPGTNRSARNRLEG